MPEITILHISDLHYDSNDTADLKIIKKAMLKNLKGEEINFILFTGDLVRKGDEENDFDGAIDFFISPILQQANLSIDNVFITPGNHDIQKSIADDQYQEEKAMRDNLINNKGTNSFLKRHMKKKDSHFFDKLKNYNHFKDNVLSSRYLKSTNNLYSTYIFETDNIRLGIACLNSVWMATGRGENQDKGELLIGDYQIQCALEDIEESDIKISIFHHPLDWLKEHDRKNLEIFLAKNCDLLFCGHLHDTNVKQVQNFENMVPIFQGNSMHTNRAFFNGYSLVRLNYEEGKGKIHFHTYMPQRDEFDDDTRYCKGGIMNFGIPKVTPPPPPTETIETQTIEIPDSSNDESINNDEETDDIEEEIIEAEEPEEDEFEPELPILSPPRFNFFKRLINNHIKVGRKLIEVLTVDEEETIMCIEEICRSRSWDILDFSRTGELRLLVDSQQSYRTLQRNVFGINRICVEIKSRVESSDQGLMLVLRLDQLSITESLAIKELVKFFRELEEKRKTAGIFLLCRAPITPPLLTREMIIENFPLPSLNEVSELLVQDEIRNHQVTGDTDNSSFEFLSQLAESLLGLNTYQIKTVLAMARANNNNILDRTILPLIHDRKRNLVKSYLPMVYKNWRELPEIRFQGYKNFLTWINNRNTVVNSFELPELDNIKPPRGVIIHGPPGVGKTEAVNEIARHWQLPILKLDLDGIFTGLSNAEGEESSTASINLSRCLWTASQMAPIILSIENIDRHFGVPTNQSQQGGGEQFHDSAQALLLNNFLNWMQENDSPVFVAATALRIENLDPEIWRKGRFDQVFYMAPPDDKQKTKLVGEFLQRRGIELEQNSLFPRSKKQNDTHNNWTAADLEYLVDETMIRLYSNNKTASPKDRENTVRPILNEIVSEMTQKKGVNIKTTNNNNYEPLYGVSVIM